MQGIFQENIFFFTQYLVCFTGEGSLSVINAELLLWILLSTPFLRHTSNELGGFPLPAPSHSASLHFLSERTIASKWRTSYDQLIMNRENKKADHNMSAILELVFRKAL